MRQAAADTGGQGAAHEHDLRPLAHSHAFADQGTRRREQALSLVVVLTLVTMVGELVAGWWTRSLALTADGWHMGTHALALGGAVLAYRLSARASRQRGGDGGRGGAAGYAFGGWKIEVLASYTSGLALAAVALWLAVDAVQALQAPRSIAYGEAAAVAAIGLLVNLLSAWLLARGDGDGGGEREAAAAPAHAHADAHAHTPAHDHHGHAHSHGDSHGHSHGESRGDSHRQPHGHAHGHDHNFSAAYMHVLADALTSVLALLALGGGAWFGWSWLDPAVALVGALVIGRWSWSVLGGAARALVDATEDPALTRRVHALIESDGDAKVADLHVWQVGPSAWCAALSVVADRPLPAADYRARLAGIDPLRHVTVEVHRCERGPAETP